MIKGFKKHPNNFLVPAVPCLLLYSFGKMFKASKIMWYPILAPKEILPKRKRFWAFLTPSIKICPVNPPTSH
jgi:hypothetical protein